MMKLLTKMNINVVRRKKQIDFITYNTSLIKNPVKDLGSLKLTKYFPC